MGNYYYPTFGPTNSLASLKNRGSRSAADAELSHFTASGNTKDSGMVEIGFHYAVTEERLWVDDSPLSSLAPGAVAWNGEEGWIWTNSPAAFHGAESHVSTNASGLHSHWFDGVTLPFAVGPDDILFGYIYLSSNTPPSEILLQWSRGGVGGGWLHRAYWGQLLLNYWPDGTDENRKIGELPLASDMNQWLRFEVPASSIGLGGLTCNGLAFDLYSGSANWDAFGAASGGPKALPVDTDKDGIPDYIEDSNGNGAIDPGESNFAISVQITSPVNGTSLP